MSSTWYKKFALALMIVFIFAPTMAHAQGFIPKPTGKCPQDKSGNAYECVEGICSGTNIPCNYSLQDIQNTVVGIGNWIFGIIGIVVLITLIYGGFLWLISAGNMEMVTKGRNIMIGSIIGLLLVLSAGVVTKWALKSVGVKDEIIDKIPVAGTTPSDGKGGPAADPAAAEFVCSCSAPTAPVQYQSTLQKCFDPPASQQPVNSTKCKTLFSATVDPALQVHVDAGLIDEATKTQLKGLINCSAKDSC